MTNEMFLSIDEMKSIGDKYRLTEEDCWNLKKTTCLSANSIGGFCDEAMTALEGIASKVNLTKSLCCALIEKAGLLNMEQYRCVYDIKIVNNMTDFNKLLELEQDCNGNCYVTYKDVYDDGIVIKDVCKYSDGDEEEYIGKFEHNLVFMIPENKRNYIKV